MRRVLARLALLIFCVAAVAFVANVLSPLTPIPNADLTGKLLLIWLFALAGIALWTLLPPRRRVRTFRHPISITRHDGPAVVVLLCALRR